MVGVDSVLIMLDVSASNEKYLVHIQHSMRQLMQEQLANKRYFNIIAYVAAIYLCVYARDLVICPAPSASLMVLCDCRRSLDI